MEPRRRWVLLATILGSAVVFLDGTVVNVALKVIGSELPSEVLGQLEGLTYVNAGYLVVLAALLILAGAAGDRYGRRRVFAIGLVGFGVTSVACGLAPTLEVLVLARLLQGASGALLVPGSLAIITASFAGEERGRAFGLWAAATSATIVLGPIVGGVLVQAVSWRAAFLINVPLVLVALFALRFVAESRDAGARRRLDWLGAALIALAIGGLSFGAIRGQDSRWSDPIAFVALGVGAVALVAFPVVMARRPDPLVPLGLFRDRAFATINLSTLVVYGALYMYLAFLALFLQGTLGYSPLASGIAAAIPALLMTFLSTTSGRVAARVGPRRFLVIGPLLMAAGLAWLIRVPADSAAWTATLDDPASLVPPTDALVDLGPAMVVYGLGIALLVAPLTTALMASVPLERAGLGSAINNAVSRVGAPLAGAALFVVVSASFYPTVASLVPGLELDDPIVQELEPLVPPGPDVPPEIVDAAAEASTQAFHLAMAVASAMLLAGAVINGVGLRGPTRVGAATHPEQEPDPPDGG